MYPWGGGGKGIGERRMRRKKRRTKNEEEEARIHPGEWLWMVLVTISAGVCRRPCGTPKAERTGRLISFLVFNSILAFRTRWTSKTIPTDQCEVQFGFAFSIEIFFQHTSILIKTNKNKNMNKTCSSCKILFFLVITSVYVWPRVNTKNETKRSLLNCRLISFLVLNLIKSKSQKRG